jgi:hypothetical protein
MVDPNALLALWFRSIAAITTLLPNRNNTNSIYAVELPPKFDPSLGPAITIMASGGFSNPEIPTIIRPRMQIKIWGDVLAVEAVRAVYSAMYDSINGMGNIKIVNGATPVGTILSCCEVTPPQDLSDPDTDWATVVSFYELIARS